MALTHPRTLLLAGMGMALFIAPGPASARQGDRAARLDSIGSSTDTVALRLLAGEAGSRSATDPDTRLAGGFAAMRLFLINGDEDDARTARDAFESAGDDTPDDAWAWYGLGLTWARGPEVSAGTPRIVTFRAFQEALGTDPASRAVRALKRALELDPALTPAATALVPVAIEKHDVNALRVARNTLAAAQTRGEFSLTALDALARAERYLGNTAAAVDAARRAATMSGDDPVARYDLAKALFLDGRDDEGSLAWHDAVDGMDADLGERIHEDLRAIADEWEEDRWDRLDTDGRREWIRDFWTTRAALSAVTVAERIGEHYRRLEVAGRRYYRHRKWGAVPTNALLLQRPDLPYDDRGLVYVRHGEPYRIITSIGDPDSRNESWVYRLPEGGFRLLHFFQFGSAMRDAAVVGNPDAMPANGGFGDGYRDFLLMRVLPCGRWVDDRLVWDKRLRLLRCNQFDQLSISAEIRRDALDALHSDSDAPAFERDLALTYDLFTFRGEDGRTDVAAGVIVPLGEMTTLPAWQGIASEFDISLIVADTMFDRVARADTLIRFMRTAPESGDALARLTLSLPVTPGDDQVQRLVVSDSYDRLHGTLAGRGIDVPDYSGRDLMISDIVLAAPDSGGSFRRGDVALSLVPTREFEGGAFRTYYEVYNLMPDSAYSTEIVIDKAGGGIGGFVRGLFGGGPEVRLRFEETASPVAGLSAQLRRVDTSLEPGDYRIRVRITDRATGRTAEKEREFTVSR